MNLNRLLQKQPPPIILDDRQKKRLSKLFGTSPLDGQTIGDEIQDLSTPLVADERFAPSDDTAFWNGGEISRVKPSENFAPEIFPAPEQSRVKPGEFATELPAPEPRSKFWDVQDLGTIDAPPETEQPKKRDASAILDEIEEVRRSPKREKSFWKRLGGGLLDGLVAFAQSGGAGGLAGAIGAIATGGIASGASPAFHADNQRTNQLQRLWGEYAQQAKAEQMQAEQEKLKTATQGQIIDNRKDALEYVRSVNKPFYDSIMADDIVTPEEAADAELLGYNIQPYDARQFDTQMVNGSIVATPRKGNPNYQPTNAPQDLLKTPVKRKLDDGTEVYTTGDKLLDDQIAEKLNQARLNIETEKYNASEANEYENRLTKWRDSISEAGGEVAKIDQELADLISTQSGGFDKFVGSESDWVRLEANIAAKKGELSKAKRRYSAVMKNAPKKPQSIGRQNLSLPKVSESVFRQQAQAKGITGANLEAAVKKAKADGVIQ